MLDKTVCHYRLRKSFAGLADLPRAWMRRWTDVVLESRKARSLETNVGSMRPESILQHMRAFFESYMEHSNTISGDLELMAEFDNWNRQAMNSYLLRTHHLGPYPNFTHAGVIGSLLFTLFASS